jgi:hypothetical protein
MHDLLIHSDVRVFQYCHSVGNDHLQEEKTLGSCGVKARLWKHWQGCHGHMQYGDFRSEQQAQFFSLCKTSLPVISSWSLAHFVDQL